MSRQLLCRRAGLALASALGTCLSLLCASCAPKEELTIPQVLVSPYDDALERPLWAVAPLANESGTSLVDNLAVTDAVVARAAEIRGLTTLPLNRTLNAMRALGMNMVRSPQDARRLAEVLGVDGIIVGSITAYDPYDPPEIGLTLGLYARPGGQLDRLGSRSAGGLDATGAARAASSAELPASGFDDRPAAVVAVHLDARNHATLLSLRRYAEGRHDRTGPMGWRAYTASIELFSEFAAQEALDRLVQAERVRGARNTLAAAKPQARSGR